MTSKIKQGVTSAVIFNTSTALYANQGWTRTIGQYALIQVTFDDGANSRVVQLANDTYAEMMISPSVSAYIGYAGGDIYIVPRSNMTLKQVTAIA